MRKLKSLLASIVVLYLASGIVYNAGFREPGDVTDALCRLSKGQAVGENFVGNVLVWPWVLRNDRATAAALAGCGVDTTCRQRVLAPSCAAGR
jgi:hypothetical protein